jgi:hypothetical protein
MNRIPEKTGKSATRKSRSPAGLPSFWDSFQPPERLTGQTLPKSHKAGHVLAWGRRRGGRGQDKCEPGLQGLEQTQGCTEPLPHLPGYSGALGGEEAKSSLQPQLYTHKHLIYIITTFIALRRN